MLESKKKQDIHSEGHMSAGPHAVPCYKTGINSVRTTQTNLVLVCNAHSLFFSTKNILIHHVQPHACSEPTQNDFVLLFCWFLLAIVTSVV